MKREVQSLKSELRALRTGHLSASEMRLPWTPEDRHRHEVESPDILVVCTLNPASVDWQRLPLWALLSSRSTQKSTSERLGTLLAEMRAKYPSVRGGLETCAERCVRTSTPGIQEHQFGNVRVQWSVKIVSEPRRR